METSATHGGSRRGVYRINEFPLNERRAWDHENVIKLSQGKDVELL
jgi:hypothetical protein